MLTATALFASLVLVLVLVPAWGSPFARALAAALRWAGQRTVVAGADVAGAAKSNARIAARRG